MVLLGNMALACPCCQFLLPTGLPLSPVPSFLGWGGLKLLLVSSSRSAPWTQDSADKDLGLGLSPSPHCTSVLAELLL